MVVHIPILVFALLLLLFPRNWLRHGPRVGGRPVRRQPGEPAPERDPNERGLKPLVEAAKPRNWIDFGRGAVGALALTCAAILAPEGGLGGDWQTLTLHGVVLGVASIVQMLRVEGRLTLFAPIYFLQGVTFGIAGWFVGLVAMVGSWALTPVLPGPGGLLFVQGAVALSLGLLLGNTAPPALMILAGVIWLPMLVSILMHRRLSASFDKRLKWVPRENRDRRAATAAHAGDGDDE